MKSLLAGVVSRKEPGGLPAKLLCFGLPAQFFQAFGAINVEKIERPSMFFAPFRAENGLGEMGIGFLRTPKRHQRLRQAALAAGVERRPGDALALVNRQRFPVVGFRSPHRPAKK